MAGQLAGDDPGAPAWYHEEDEWGAQWVRCALQVRPFSSDRRHPGTPATDEETYNRALVDALVCAGIEIVAITDRSRVKSSVSLANAARKAGLTALLGFEASTSEGVRMLCIFDASCDVDAIDRRIGQCGVEPDAIPSPNGTVNVRELIARCDAWGAACIAAHVTCNGELLQHPHGPRQIEAWTAPDPVATAITRSSQALPEPHPGSVLDRARRRDLPVGVTSAGDGPPFGRSCRLRLSERSLEAIRQAFMDPETRVRPASDRADPLRPTVRAIHWEGGLLSGQTVRFADELTVLVGAAGAGKSAVIESLRAAFEQLPRTPRAREDHRAIVSQVLGSETTISVVVHYPVPAPTTYVVERTLPHPAVVRRADTWAESGLKVDELQPAPQIYGQHELAALAEDAQRRTALLERFVETSPDRDVRRQRLRRDLAMRRRRIVKQAKIRADLESRLSLLPGNDERLCRYGDAGVAAKLEPQTRIDRELRVIQAARAHLASLRDVVDELDAALPPDVAAETDLQLAESPFLEQLQTLDATRRTLSGSAQRAVAQVRAEVDAAAAAVEGVFAAWERRRHAADAELRVVRDQLGDDDLYETYRSLRASVDELNALMPTLDEANAALACETRARGEALVECEQLAAEEARDYEQAAAQVSGALRRMLKVSTIRGVDHAAVENLLRPQGGRLAEIFELFRQDERFSPRDLAARIRTGTGALQQRWTLSDAQAQRLALTDTDTVLQLEELEVTVSTNFELNVGTGDAAPRWRRLEELPKAQKATAILLLLLLDSQAPLVVDQPEADLENRFIADRIAPAVRAHKASRQLIVATHDADVPVLADAELVVGLVAEISADGRTRASAPIDRRGSVDAPAIKRLIEERLEGGRAAYLERQRRYGQ